MEEGHRDREYQGGKLLSQRSKEIDHEKRVEEQMKSQKKVHECSDYIVSSMSLSIFKNQATSLVRHDQSSFNGHQMQ